MLLHGGEFGFVCSLDCWSLNLPGLAERFHVYAPDKLGQGYTDNPRSEQDYTIDAVIEHLLGFLQALNITSAHLVGHSRGGLPVAGLAVQYPHLVKSVVIMDTNVDRLRELDSVMAANVTTIYSDPYSIDEYVVQADLVIGAVLVPGRRPPRLVSADLVKRMKPGAVIVDVSIDQGGCIETSRPTTHHDPIYVVNEVVHYCVGNIPGSVPRTATYALTNATLPYLLALANEGLMTALGEVPGFASGLNVYRGQVTNGPVAKSLGLPYSSGALEP